MQTIYYIDYDTESSDNGQVGYWTEEPTDKQIRKYLKKEFPDEFYQGDCTIYWRIKSFNPQTPLK